MHLRFVDPKGMRLDHELIWGSILLLGVVGVVLFPLEDVRLRCTFKTLTGWPCLTCGMTRSLIALRRLNVAGAFAMNPLVAAAALFAALFGVYALVAVVFRTRRIRLGLTRRLEMHAIRIAIVVIAAANWLYLIWAGR